MQKEILTTIVFILLLSLTTFAQKNKSNQSNEQPAMPPQITLEQRLSELSKDISDELTGNQKTIVAIADFVDLNGNSSNFGKFLAEELVTRLFKTKKLKVIERQRLDKVIAEQKLSLTDVIEASSAKRIGRILGVDAIVAGTISELGSNFKINARIISTETGELLAAAGATVAKDLEICSLISCSTQSNLAKQGVRPGISVNPKLKVNDGGQEDSVKSEHTLKRRAWTIDSDFFTFEIQKCRISGTAVICDYTVTNNNQDRQIGISYQTKMFDDFNGRYEVNYVTLANASSNGFDITAYAYLVSGVKAKGRIEFKRVSAEATKITLLEIHYFLDGGNGSSVKLRDIPLRE